MKEANGTTATSFSTRFIFRRRVRNTVIRQRLSTRPELEAERGALIQYICNGAVTPPSLATPSLSTLFVPDPSTMGDGILSSTSMMIQFRFVRRKYSYDSYEYAVRYKVPIILCPMEQNVFIREMPFRQR